MIGPIIGKIIEVIITIADVVITEIIPAEAMEVVPTAIMPLIIRTNGEIKITRIMEIIIIHIIILEVEAVTMEEEVNIRVEEVIKINILKIQIKRSQKFVTTTNVLEPKPSSAKGIVP